MNATPTTVEKAMGEAVRFDAWRSVFEKTNRIISGRPIQVSIEDRLMNLPPSWTDGQTVTFHAGHVREMLRMSTPLDAVLRLKGLNYHELSHVLYSPRASDELTRLVLKRQVDTGDPMLWKAFNALEDQRIETWFTAAFGPSRRYFEATVFQWLIRDGNAEAAILLYGRKYLPAKLRVDAGDIFTKKYGPDLYRRFREVIDDYLKVVIPADTQRAFALVKSYRELLREMADKAGGQLPQAPIADNACHDDQGPHRDAVGVIKAGRAGLREGRAAQRQAQEAVEEADAAAEAYAADKAAGQGAGQGDGDAGEAPGQGESAGQDGAPGEGSNGPTDSANGQAAASEADGAGGNGVGGGAADHDVISPEDFKDLAQDVADMIEAARDGMAEIAADEAVVKDAEKVLDAVKAVVANGQIDAHGGMAKRSTVPPREADLQTLRRIVQVLTKIRQEAEPQLLRRQTTGRVDARRALTRRPNEIDVFTQYDEGDEDATGAEAVILLDMSGSMGQMMPEACRAAWVLKRGFDKVGIRTTVLAYDTATVVIWQGRDKAKADVPVLAARGGTDPTDALRQAALILRKSNAANKVLVTVTDGGWSADPKVVAGLMKTMHGAGVVSTLLAIGGERVIRMHGAHDHMSAHGLDTVKDLPKAVLRLVSDVMRGALERAV